MSEDNASSIYLPSSQLERLHEVHNTLDQTPERSALWRTVSRGLDALEREASEVPRDKREFGERVHEVAEENESSVTSRTSS